MWLNEIYQSLDPIAFQLGPLAVRWYGLAYLAGFIVGAIIVYRIAHRWGLDLSVDDLISLAVGVAFGAIIGGRLGYVIFYGAGYYLEHPAEIIMLNQGGMSFHGGLVGAIVGGVIACRIYKLSAATMADLAVIGATWGLFFGRCANFVNGELWGKECDLPWAVAFESGGGVFRHPSQLYEAILEGIVIFVILWLLSRKMPPRPQGTFMGAFLVLYGVFRFAIEFVRLPDSQLGYLLGTDWLTMGQVLSLPLVVVGIGILIFAAKKNSPQRLNA